MKALILIADGFEDIEFFHLYYRLQEEGVDVTVTSIHGHTLTGQKGYRVEPDLLIRDIAHTDFDLLLIPGGTSPERLRTREEAVGLTRSFMQEGQMVATISHGIQLLISAGSMDARAIACSPSIRDDARASGGRYRDEAVVVDDNLITGRSREDLPEFTAKVVELIGQRVG